jgi:site-specific DNA recombinase
MGPSFSSKNGVRYRFYVSSALLRGRKASAGSVGRVAAPEIERTILAALEAQSGRDSEGVTGSIGALKRVVVCRDKLLVSIAAPDRESNKEIRIAWSTATKDAPSILEGAGSSEEARNEVLIQALVRAHGWIKLLRDGVHESVEDIAEANRIHPKVVRQALRLAFLAPDVTTAILEGRQPVNLSLGRIPKLLPLPWTEHRHLLG